MSKPTPRSTSAAMISVIEKARGREDRWVSSHLFAIVLMAVFFIALMGSLAIGASLYRSTAEAQTHANALHLQSGLLTNVIHNNDTAGAVTTGVGPEGPSLVLLRRLSSGTYETRIYLYEGSVVQESAVAGRPYDPAGATALLPSSHFSFTIEDGLVSISTDEGSFVVALRSAPEAPEAPNTERAPVEVETILDEGGLP